MLSPVSNSHVVVEGEAIGRFLQIELLLALLCDAIKMKTMFWYYLCTCCQWPRPPWLLLLHKTLPLHQDKLKHTSRCPPTLSQCCEITYLVGYWLSFERASKVSVKWLKHLHLLSRSRIKAWSSPTLNPVAKQWWMSQKGSTTSGWHRFISPEYLADAPSEFARLRARQFVALLFPSKVTLRTKVLINR